MTSSRVCGDRIGAAACRLSDQAAHEIRLVRGAAAPAEGRNVHGDGFAVEFDRLFDRLRRQRQTAMLEGEAEHEHVGAERIAEKCRQPCAWRRRNAPSRRPPPCGSPSSAVRPGAKRSAERANSPGMISAVLATKMRVVFAHGGEHLPGARHDEVAAEDQVRLSRPKRGSRGCRRASWRCGHG